jgi:hypothetical protein
MVALLLLCLLGEVAQATVPGPPPDTNGPVLLDSWSFNDTTNWPSDLGYAPISFTNLDSSLLGNGSALLLDSTNPAWLQCNVIESDGTTNLTVDNGTVLFWFAPTSWSGTNQGGTGPSGWGRLLEVGSYTTNASYGWWSLYLDPDGVNLYFSAQSNDGSQAAYLAVPIAWTTNRWHFVALTYCATNTALYLDGQPATNGPGITCRPGPEVLAPGFWIGSDSNGVAQARGMFDDLATFADPLDGETIGSIFNSYYIIYYLNPMNIANVSSAPSTPSSLPTFNAITGPGWLQSVGASGSCVTNSAVWLTNLVCSLTTNLTANFSFSIAGGTDGLLYDVFANAVIGPPGSPGYQWAWQGQGYHCNTYLLTNLPSTAAFLILGTPQDSDGDGLTDAYERLASKTDPTKPDTSGDGMLDGWKVMWGLNPVLRESLSLG